MTARILRRKFLAGFAALCGAAVGLLPGRSKASVMPSHNHDASVDANQQYLAYVANSQFFLNAREAARLLANELVKPESRARFHTEQAIKDVLIFGNTFLAPYTWQTPNPPPFVSWHPSLIEIEMGCNAHGLQPIYYAKHFPKGRRRLERVTHIRLRSKIAGVSTQGWGSPLAYHNQPGYVPSVAEMVAAFKEEALSQFRRFLNELLFEHMHERFSEAITSDKVMPLRVIKASDPTFVDNVRSMLAGVRWR